MTLAKAMIPLLLLALLLACAGPLPRRDLEKERQEEKKESAPPTFTYRP